MGTIVEKSCRYRVNVSQTSTGKMSWDCTVDMEGETMADILQRSDSLVAELRHRYPLETGEKRWEN